MKRLILTTIILGTFAFANSQNVIDQNTELTVLSGEYSKDFAKNVNTLVKESGVKELYKKRLEENARIAEKQNEMKSKYKLDTTPSKSISKYQLVKARAIQAKKAEVRAKNYLLNKSNKFLTKEVCSTLKESQVYQRAVCKVKHQNKIDEALSDLDSLLENDKNLKAYCMKSMIRLMKNSSEALSETTKDFVLKKIRGYKNNNQICNKAFAIASSK